MYVCCIDCGIVHASSLLNSADKEKLEKLRCVCMYVCMYVCVCLQSGCARRNQRNEGMSCMCNVYVCMYVFFMCVRGIVHSCACVYVCIYVCM